MSSSEGFIPLFRFDSSNMKDVEHTMYVNKNRIYAFSHFNHPQLKECLIVKFDRYVFPREYLICKEENPTAYNELFKGVPEKIAKNNAHLN